MLNPRSQAQYGHEAPVFVVSGVITIETMRERLFLRFRCKLGNQERMFDADLTFGECSRGGFYEVEEYQSFGKGPRLKPLSWNSDPLAEVPLR